jgi:hypothetical protein
MEVYAMITPLFSLSAMIQPDDVSENDKGKTHIVQTIETKFLWILTLLL